MQKREHVEEISALRDIPFEESGNLPAAGIHASSLLAGITRAQRKPEPARH
jgi:hypothetical protein